MPPLFKEVFRGAIALLIRSIYDAGYSIVEDEMVEERPVKEAT